MIHNNNIVGFYSSKNNEIDTINDKFGHFKSILFSKCKKEYEVIVSQDPQDNILYLKYFDNEDRSNIIYYANVYGIKSIIVDLDNKIIKLNNKEDQIIKLLFFKEGEYF